jgi:curved DNA-binding protein CbpA
MTQSLYAVLNVAPDADPAVIEAAYKALIKKYHPDMLAGGPGGDMRRASEINEAFQVLRDPDRRARYDNDERARQGAFRRASAAASIPAGPPIYRAHPPRRRKSRWPVVLLLVAAVAAFMIWRETDAGRRLLSSGGESFALQAAPGVERSTAVRVADVDRAFEEFRKIKDRTGLLGLSAFSQDCFAGQSRSQSAAEFDFCVAFDHAAAGYDAQIAGDDLPQLPRFRPDELNSRHEWAARLVSSDEKWIAARLAQLRALSEERMRPAAEAVQATPAPLVIQAQQVTPIPVAKRSVRRVRAVRYVRAPRAMTPKGAARTDRDFLEREGYIY